MFTSAANTFKNTATATSTPAATPFGATRAQAVTTKEQGKRIYNAISPFGKINQDLTRSITDSEAKSISLLRNQSLSKTTI